MTIKDVYLAGRISAGLDGAVAPTPRGSRRPSRRASDGP